MAWLEQRGDSFHVCFRFNDQKFKKSLKTRDQQQAEFERERIERRLRLIESGDLEIHPEVDFATFILSDGKLRQPVKIHAVTLHELLREYEATLVPERLEPKTIETIKLHIKHVRRLFDRTFRSDALKFRDLQNYVDSRSRETFRGNRPISATTIKKELATFRGAWNWGSRMSLVKGTFPSHGLTFNKSTEKPPFQTRSEIERQIGAGKLTAQQKNDLWSCLYLTVEEIDDVLTVIRERSRHDFIFPMVLLAAHTGARRSEIARPTTHDFELETGFVLLREKKRVRGKTTTRKAPMSPYLWSTMSDWLSHHASGPAFMHESKAVTAKDATHHLTWTLKGSRWECIHGWHVFRHSFISNCASRGVDQRMIDEWVGHTTEEMRKRYRHLLPDAQQAALATVFGGTRDILPRNADNKSRVGT